MIEYVDPVPYEPEQFFQDVRRTAAAITAPFDDALVRRSLELFDDEMHRSVVQLKATSVAGAGLYYRFFYKWENDLIGIAQRHGLLRRDDAPIVTLQREVLDMFPEATRAGLDFETGFGLAKAWTFTGVRPIEDLFKLAAIPDSVRSHAEFFARHGLRRVFFVASDYQGETMNLYPIVEAESRNPDWLRRLVEETGGAPAETPDYPHMIESLAVTACLGMTFSWNSPEMRRWSLYGLNMPYLDTQAAALPTLPPRLKTFLDQAPTLNPSPQINVAWSYGKAGFYTKLEKSYAKDANYFHTTEMACDMRHLAGSVPGRSSPPPT